MSSGLFVKWAYTVYHGGSKSLALLVNSQLVASRQLRVLILLCYI